MAEINIPTGNDLTQGINAKQEDNSITENLRSIQTDTGTETSHRSYTSDYNDVVVTIKDKRTPIVILFGPASCGKTMTLVRLSRYLQENGYKVTPDKSFRSSDDSEYQKLCKSFPVMINSDDAAQGTTEMEFMLAKVIKSSFLVCQILEAKGELYFDVQDPKKESPTYLNQITTAPNRKIWVFMLEPDWKNESDRNNYVQRIKSFAKHIQSKDKVILLMNKIDKADGLVIKTGIIKQSALIKEVKDSYPGILEPFVNTIPISNWFEKYNCKIVPFQTGLYSVTMDGKLKYTKSDDIYPRRLWNIINKIVRG